MSDITKDKLVSDIKVVIADAEELLRATAGEAGGKIAAARAKVEESLDGAKRRLADVGAAAEAQARVAARATDEFVHDHPWKAVGIGAALGVILGMLISRK